MKNLKNRLDELVYCIYGGNNRTIQVTVETKNNIQDVSISVYELQDGLEEEMHYAHFTSILDAIDFYLNKMQKKTPEEVPFIEGEDGVFELNVGYENQPVEDILDKKVKSIANMIDISAVEASIPYYSEFGNFKVLGYRPRTNFTNDNGKVFIKLEVEIPMDIEPCDNVNERMDYHITTTPSGFEDGEFIGNATDSLFTRMLKYFSASNSKVRTEPGTNISIYEVFFGNKKVDRIA